MTARWIWLPDAPHDVDVFVFARRVVRLEADLETRLRISCDGRYELFLDGLRLGRGPVRSEPADRSIDAYPVTLRAGTHVLGVLARCYGRPTLYWKPGPGCPLGIIAELEGVTATDHDWRVLRAPYTPTIPAPDEGAPDPEAVDGRAWPHGWLEHGLDDADWLHAEERPGPSLEELPPRPIGFLTERVIPLGDARTLAPGEPALFDLGTITNAHVALEAEAAAGTTVEVRCGEDRDGDRILVDVRDWSLRYTAAGLGAPERLEAFEPMGFRYLRVTADAPGTVRVSAIERITPRAPGASFRCSDPALERIWEAGARTLELCSTDAFVDCPSREQRAWLGDDAVNTMISLAVNPSLGLPLHDLRLHAAAQRPDGLLPQVAAGDFTDRPHTLPDQSLHWISTLARLYEHTGDADLLHELLPVAERILDAFEAMRGADGLLAGYVHGLHGWWFIDWAQTERGDRIAAIDALYALALRATHELRAAIDADPRDLAARYEATRAAFEAYWDDVRGVYVDARWDDGHGGRRVSQQTNAAAICAGLVPAERVARILERITAPARIRITATPGDGGTFGERLNRQWEQPVGFDDEEHVVAAQPFFCHLLHEAFVRSDRRDLLLASIRRWSPMVARNGLVEEYWTALPGMGSRCHAWSGTPTHDLTRFVLGVRASEPGWSSVLVDPFLGDLDWAEGSVPTPRGFVHVRAERGAPPRIEAPEGMRILQPGQGNATNRGR